MGVGLPSRVPVVSGPNLAQLPPPLPTHTTLPSLCGRGNPEIECTASVICRIVCKMAVPDADVAAIIHPDGAASARMVEPKRCVGDDGNRCGAD